MYLLSLDWGQAEFHLCVWGEGHVFLEEGFQTFVVDMGSTNSRVELVPMQEDENSMLHLRRVFLSFLFLPSQCSRQSSSW